METPVNSGVPTKSAGRLRAGLISGIIAVVIIGILAFLAWAPWMDFHGAHGYLPESEQKRVCMPECNQEWRPFGRLLYDQWGNAAYVTFWRQVIWSSAP